MKKGDRVVSDMPCFVQTPIPLHIQNILGLTRLDLEKKKRELIKKMFPKGGDRGNQYKVANSENLSLADVGITFNESSDAKVINNHCRKLVYS